MENQKIEITDLIQLVSFKVGREEFGIDILKVQEINRMLKITKVPNAPDFVEGVVNLRGRIIPVIDLRKRLKIESREHDNKTRIVVVDITGNTVGFIVDEVNEVLRIPKDIIENPPELVATVDSEFITSVAKLEDRIIILLDLDNLLKQDEQANLDKLTEQ
ncbi:MAG: chemotaxis protein CheW [Melioribacteraceae bacterium]|jgi:purine-binding chemotaxis protein CheW|nr:chemotaxis protein CheW [Melioribacteraceae bacterium]RJP63148.1 MAG: purine-binding chemotaxis protein CheW [Ignavibacteriales bacterium]WKZ70132.1 MAG: chemotaxis protein CheW [Melioribacteraceae bacterium]